MTRATRQIGSAIEATPFMKKIFDGKQNTKDLQKEFGKKIALEGIKTSGKVRDDSGGHRTWMTLLKVFGLCYEDEDKIVRFTPAGNIVAKGDEQALRMMEIQVMNFQFPNRTQEHHSQKMDESFEIFPYRFLAKLLLRIEYLTIQEISLFVLPIKSEKDFIKVVESIEAFRKSNKIIDYNAHQKKYASNYDGSGYKKYIEDLAGTFKNHLEFFEGISSERRGKQHHLYIEKEYQNAWSKKIKYFETNFKLIPTYPEESRKFFVDRYGMLPDRKKASTKTSKPVTKIQTKIRKIQNAFEDILEESPSRITIKEIVGKIKVKTFISEKDISSILSKYPELFQMKYNAFESKYLDVAGNGERWKEFEKDTNKIFQIIGFDVGYQKQIKLSRDQKGFLDGYVTLGLKAGLIDSKAGKEFSCGNKEVGIMKDYIEEAKKISDGKKLEFFGYVYGRKFSGTSGFDRISSQTGIKGFRISAANLLHLMRAVDEGKISKEKIWELFQKNGEITSDDY